MVATTFAGQNLYDVPGLLDPDFPVHVPEDTGTFLDLDDAQQGRLHDAMGTFAGGLFATDGFQYHPEGIQDGPFKGRYFVPLDPSGLKQANEPEGFIPEDPAAGAAAGQFNIGHMFQIQDALQQMNPGMTGRVHAGQVMRSAGLDENGMPTFEMIKGNPMSPEFMSPNGGYLTDFTHPQTQEKWTIDQMVNQAAANIGNLDYSGWDGGEGSSGGGGEADADGHG
jgi:hypothetical protein